MIQSGKQQNLIREERRSQMVKEALWRIWSTMLMAILVSPIYAYAASEKAAVPLKAQVAGDAKKTRFVAFLSKSVEYRIFPIADPYRIVIDMPETEIQVPGNISRGLVLSSRAGSLTAGQSRIVIDLAEPALVEKAEVMPAEDGTPARLVLDLVKTTFKAFAAASKTPPPIQTAATKPDAPIDTLDKRMVLVLDAGHGGVDAGAHGRVSNTPEKEVTLDVCQEMRRQLEKSGRYRIVLTRESDEFVALDDRAATAAKNRAVLLISIHADAVDPKVHGVKGTQEIWGGSIHTLSDQPSDEQAKALIQNENNADAKAGFQNASVTQDASEGDAFLNELENRTKKNRSLAFANYMVDQMKNKIRMNVKPHRFGNLRVLKAAGVPSVLIELGYLSNDEDEKLLISKEWRAKTAEQLSAAVQGFMTERQVQLPQ